MTVYTCPHCGVSFETDGSFSARGKFAVHVRTCSSNPNKDKIRECMVAAGRKQRQKHNAVQHTASLASISTYTFECERCGCSYSRSMKPGEYGRYKTARHFCSRSCANSRPHSLEQKRRISEKMKQWHATHPTLHAETQSVVHHKRCGLRKTFCLDCGKEIWLCTTAETYCPNCMKNHPHTQKYNVYDSTGQRVFGGTTKSVKWDRTDPNLKHTIYKTVNDLDGKFYIGKHQTFNPNDSYLGSGVHLTRAIAKYGRKHFHKEVLFVFNTEEEMNNKEKELITEDLLRDPQCYNMTFGGEGGDTWSFAGRHHSEETKKKLREIALQKRKDPEYIKRNKIAHQQWRQQMKLEHPEEYAEMLMIRIAKMTAANHGGNVKLRDEQSKQEKLVPFNEIEEHIKSGWRFGHFS